MTASISRRITGLKKLARQYQPMEDGALIEKHTEILRFFDIRGSKHKKHPHKMKRVYISRKALKHVVESRKKELTINHTQQEAMDGICFLLEQAQEVIINFDLYVYEEPTYIYIKKYTDIGKPFIRILVEDKNHGLEIKSIHFSKNKRL
jgi:hypothetical protein